ncbi:MAG: hypothetical protein ACO3SP_04725 [Ilumatobacteraceae bacterium]
MLECVVNVSEGRRPEVLRKLARAVDPGDLLDVHVDPWHHRSVWTLVGTTAPRRLTRQALELLDLSEHQGAHPRLGVVDVVPFVPFDTSSMDDAHVARDEFAHWAADDLQLPSFLYGPADMAPHRSLPEIRRRAWSTLQPDIGPPAPHPTGGAMCVGARPVLVAYNIWLQPGADWTRATEVTASIRTSQVRALTLRLGDRVQISMNLVEPLSHGPLAAYEDVSRRCAELGLQIERAELVGLVPTAVLTATPRHLWPTLDLATERTIEYRFERGYSPTL